MKSQLYLHNRLRQKLKSDIELIVSTYNKRIAPVFSNIEKEKAAKKEERF
ncbi:MAG: hypothetical protein IPO22_00570 [Anaerolineales bacterium]|nr:hypothetical protein [Anaerolineales bacterium]